MTSDGPFLTVVVRTQGRRPASLSEAIASLEAAGGGDATDVEILVVHHLAAEHDLTTELPPGVHAASPVRCVRAVGGGRARPLNVGLDHARGAYVAFLDDDDVALPGMVAAFRAGARTSPGAVLRARTLAQRWRADPVSGEPRAALGLPERVFADHFDLLEHLHDNSTPICSIALPAAALREAGFRFDEDLPALEDWHMLVRAALRFGVVDIPEDVAVYRRTDGGNSASAVTAEEWSATRARIVERFEDGACILPRGTIKRLSAADFQRDGPPAAAAEIERVREELAALRREFEAVLASRSYRLLAPARRLLGFFRSRSR